MAPSKIRETHFVLPARFKCRYGIRRVPRPRELILLLHGYEQTGPGFLARVEKALPRNAIILAPNAPYPVRHCVGNRLSLGFSWYFFEPHHRDDYYVPRDLSIQYLKKLIASLGYSRLPKRIVGYSQGGYISPFVAQELSRVKQIVGINCRFLADEFRGKPRFRMDAIHGAKDKIVDAKLSEKAFAAFKARGVTGEFHIMKGLGHRVVPAIQRELGRILDV